MDKMKLNNNDITVVPRFIDESMLPTIESIKQNNIHGNIPDQQTSKENNNVVPKENTNNSPKEKWYIKYKWYIIASIIFVIIAMVIYFYFSSTASSLPDNTEYNSLHDKKIKSNILHDNESVASDLFYPKKLTTIEEEYDEEFDTPPNKSIINTGTSDNDDKINEKWINDTRKSLLQKNDDEKSSIIPEPSDSIKSESSDKYNVLDDSESNDSVKNDSIRKTLNDELGQTFYDDQKSVEEFNETDVPIMQEEDYAKKKTPQLSSIDDLLI